MALSLESNYYVYALVDPINKVPFYMGKGKNKRAWDHVRGYDKRNSKKVSYIKNIRILGLEPEVHIIKSNMSNKDSREYESVCIKESRNLGLPLTNIKLDEGSNPWTSESRKKLSNTMKRIGRQGGIEKGGSWYSKKSDKVNKSEVYSLMSNNKSKKEICQIMGISYYVLQQVIKNG